MGGEEQMKGKYPEYPAEPISDVRDLFLNSTEKYRNRIALQYKKGGSWIPISFGELRSIVEEAACGFAALDLKPVENKVAIIGDNRPEWAASYLAAACTGIVCVPIDKELREIEAHNILYLSGAETLVSDDKHIEMALKIQKKLPRLTTLINMDRAQGDAGVLGFQQLCSMGRERIRAGKNDFLERTVSPDDLLSILFTSGTTGNPKGVMLTHRNVAVNIQDAVKWVNLNGEDRFLSVLPIHHSYECTDGFLLAIYVGALTSYAENIRRMAENMAETKATAVLGVPLLWNAIYKKIEAALAEKGMRKVTIAKKVAEFCERFFGMNIRRLIFAKVHERFGGHLRILISGGAAADPLVARGFRELGIAYLQGYGLTESAPIITVNRDKAFKDNAAGLPLPNVEVKIDEDGEVLARGPNIMKGYYNNPEATSTSIRDGWLHTGDLGYLDEDGFLHIQGRKKSVIVTPGGKKIYPEEVEEELLRSPLILECLVWGDTAPNPGEDVEIRAMVVPNIENFIKQGLAADAVANNSRLEAILKQEVKERCQNLSKYKRVTRVEVRYEEFEKTTTKKIKRFLYTGTLSDRDLAD
jgi:long-chain acyl-CoA synthetase